MLIVVAVAVDPEQDARDQKSFDRNEPNGECLQFPEQDARDQKSFDRNGECLQFPEQDARDQKSFDRNGECPQFPIGDTIHFQPIVRHDDMIFIS